MIWIEVDVNHSLRERERPGVPGCMFPSRVPCEPTSSKPKAGQGTRFKRLLGGNVASIGVHFGKIDGPGS